MKKLTRDYQGSDGYMIETSSALQVLFLDNVANFTAFDSTLDAAFGADWLSKIEAASTAVIIAKLKTSLLKRQMMY